MPLPSYWRRHKQWQQLTTSGLDSNAGPACGNHFLPRHTNPTDAPPSHAIQVIPMLRAYPYEYSLTPHELAQVVRRGPKSSRKAVAMPLHQVWHLSLVAATSTRAIPVHGHTNRPPVHCEWRHSEVPKLMLVQVIVEQPRARHELTPRAHGEGSLRRADLHLILLALPAWNFAPQSAELAESVASMVLVEMVVLARQLVVVVVHSHVVASVLGSESVGMTGKR